MQPKKFPAAAERLKRETFGRSKDVRIIAGDHTKSGQQIRVYRGHLPDEQRAGSIGHFLVVTADTLPNTPATSEVIPAGSVAVRHPSYSARYGRGGWAITTRAGIIDFPAEQSQDGVPTLAGEAILSDPVPEEVKQPEIEAITEAVAAIQ